MTSWFGWSICLARRKTPPPFGDTVAISSSSAPDFASHTACFATCLASCTLLLYNFSTCSFRHQISDRFHLQFLNRRQTLVAASSGGPFSFDQAAISRNSSCTSIGGNSSHSDSTHHFYNQGRLDMANSIWVTELPGADHARWELAFRHMEDVSGEVAHCQVKQFEALLVKIQVADCAAESLAVSSLAAWAVYD